MCEGAGGFTRLGAEAGAEAADPSRPRRWRLRVRLESTRIKRVAASEAGHAPGPGRAGSLYFTHVSDGGATAGELGAHARDSEW